MVILRHVVMRFHFKSLLIVECKGIVSFSRFFEQPKHLAIIFRVLGLQRVSQRANASVGTLKKTGRDGLGLTFCYFL